mmetsp:Transcript_8991/g.7995  ORF Transcript_8991/g.7995 Transcript_8991/m.7995 type:complete len:80 (+) Transcript_8991:993-1232(+)
MTGYIIFYVCKALLWIINFQYTTLLLFISNIIRKIKQSVFIWNKPCIKFRNLRWMVYKSRMENYRYNTIKKIKDRMRKN